MSSRGVPPPSDGSYARLVGGVAVRLDRRSELTAVGEVYRRKRKYDGLYEPPSIFTLGSLRFTCFAGPVLRRLCGVRFGWSGR